MKAFAGCGRHWAVVVAVMGVLAIGAGSSQAGMFYVSPAGDDGHNGTSWATAKRTVQAALNASQSGEVIWVAAGTYVERITLKAGVVLYGGFAGTETDFSQRNWTANVTILDGNKAGTVVTSPAGATTSTRIDGFTIRNGKATNGGGINCTSSSPTITNNTIVDNNESSYGGGIYCSSSSPLITYNVISGNKVGGYGGGIYCNSSSATISNNRIANNVASRGGGIYCTLGAPIILGNTITGNHVDVGDGGGIYSESPAWIANNLFVGNTSTKGGALYCRGYMRIANNTIAGNNADLGGAGVYVESGSPAIWNSIIALNSTGVFRQDGTPSLRYNCVYGNGVANYSGLTDPTGTNGNISVDPRLVALQHGNAHIQPDSPCVDAGDDSEVVPGWKDIDGQTRIQGTCVDIGADESDGTVWPEGPYAIVRVSPQGDDASDGSSWALAKRSVQAGLDAAAAAGGEVWVAADTYSERITLRRFAHLYGGFAGTETDRAERDWAENRTILDGGKAGIVVTCDGNGYRLSTIDGFTIRNGKGSSGGGIYCGFSSPTIANNTIRDNSAYSGGGIYNSWSSPLIFNNIITDNSIEASTSGGGIHCHGGYATIANSTISRNYGGGIYCNSSSPTISNNMIASNSASSSGGGIRCSSSAAMISGNTIVGNIAGSGGGVHCTGSSPTIVNTIVAFNSSGIAGVTAGNLRHNCVYGNEAYNYSDLTDPTGTSGNISVDPGLANWQYGNVHIQPSSPCIDAGDDGAASVDAADMDGQPRTQGSHVDIGADESDGTTWPAGPYTIVRVSSSGDDANDGSSWAQAKRTVQAGIDAAAVAGGDVWVAAGTYVERISLRAFSHVYGGFAGVEIDREARDWSANVTVLDGDQAGTVVSANGTGQLLSTIDGFTIRNGKATTAGILCAYSAVTISHNTITDNAGRGLTCVTCSPVVIGNTIARNTGNGIYCITSSATISNNTITGNNAPTGGGIHCSSSSPTIANNTITNNIGHGVYCSHSSPTITSNTITGNSATLGAGIYCEDSASPTIANTIIAFNSSGIHKAGMYGGPSLRYNCVYGNTAYDYSGVADPTGTNGNLSVDPRLANVPYGNVHIQPDSPCLDAGDDSLVQAGWVDMDGQPRTQGAHTDIGADESDGTVWAGGTNGIVRVSPAGDDANDGSSWTLGKRTVQAAIDAAAAMGGEVWVQAGTYAERITLRSYVHIYGGFAGTEAERIARDWARNVTVLDASRAGRVVTADKIGSGAATLDGFTIRNGTNGIYCSYASPVLANNTITGNKVAGSGGGIYCTFSSPTIINNRIVSNSAGSGSDCGGGIYCSNSSPAILNNTILFNSSAYGGGIYCIASSLPTIAGNTIAGNSSSTAGGGIHCDNGSSPKIQNNTITGNSSPSYAAGLHIYTTASPSVTNNTITNNEGAGLYTCSSTGRIANTIVAFNTRGVTVSSANPSLRYNCVYGNTSYNYTGISDPTGTNGNISADPKLAAAAYRNVHLQPGSPCQDAGDDALVAVGWTDIDGQARILGTHVDIGADESDGTTWPTIPNAIVRVAPEGNDANDGASWGFAKQTVQAGIDAAALLGGEVWVRAGTYPERISLRPYAHVYGGFAGGEADRVARNWGQNLTILDGERGGSVVTANLVPADLAAIDGFTIRNGQAWNGGGIYCYRSSVIIANSTITCNSAANGGGIGCAFSSPRITNTTITGNSAGTGDGKGGGISCDSSSPKVTNVTIAGNRALYGGGMSCSSASPVVVNTIIAFNSSGLYKEGSAGTPLLRYNCVYGNGAYNYQGLADPTGTEGNLSVDPGLAAPFYENVHIQPDSPCVDAGDDGAVEAGWADMDCQTRILGSHVDIGADESDGTVWPSGSRRIIRVSPTGDDANDGSSWAAAKQTVQAAIDVAAVTGGEVWVAAGTYMENIDLKVSIYGGFAGHETDVSERDWQVNETVLDGNQANSVVIATPTVDPAVCIDGFTLRNGSGQPGEARYGGGIYCRVASPTIANNKIVGNSATGVSVGYGGAIYCSASSATIANNTIQGNNASSYGGGIACYQGSPKILSNTIAANSAARSGSSGGQGGGVHCLNASASIIGNTISANTSTGHGGAIYCTGGSVTIAGNAIAGNRATSTGGYGGGIYCTSSILIANNTILANGASKGGGIYFSSSPTIVNTIVAFNSSGICQYQAGTPVLSWNCVYGNTAYNYSGLPDPTGTNGSISADPLFVSASSGLDEIWGTADDTYADLRLLPWSPCIDAGSNTGVPADAADLDDDGDVTEPLPVDVTGQLRFLDDPQVADTGAGTPPIVDMGAYERGRPASDVDGDWLTDVVDLLYMVDAFGTYSGDADYDPRCDFNADGAVDVVDLLDIVYNFGK